MSLYEDFSEKIAIGALFQDIGIIIAKTKGTCSDYIKESKNWLNQYYPKDVASLQEYEDLLSLLNVSALSGQSSNIDYSLIKNSFLKIDYKENSRDLYFPLRPSKVINSTTNNKTSQKNYEELFKNFESDFLKINRYNVNALLFLIKKHFSFVPVNGDISFYDQSCFNALLACCLFHYLNNNSKQLSLPIKDRLKQSLDEKAFLLIGGDISGIQNFIYAVATSTGALKSFKGRSFYLELLTEHVVNEILNQLGLFRFNIYFTGAGHFYIIAYNTDKAKNIVNNIKERINNFLLKEFNGLLQFHIDFIEFPITAFMQNLDLQFIDYFNDLKGKLEISKKKKWNDFLDKVFMVETPHPDCYTEGCSVCQREDKPLTSISKPEKEVKYCSSCYSQYKLGEQLTKLSFLEKSMPCIYKYDLDSETRNSDCIIIDNSCYVFNPDIAVNSSTNKPKNKYLINCTNAYYYNSEESIYFPAGIYNNSDIVELSDVKGYFGKDLVSVLKMDVDNLGWIFSLGIPKEYRTFTRMSNISELLTHFFKYSSNYIAKGSVPTQTSLLRDIKEGFERRISIVYAGGDDLLVVGHWLDILEFSIDIDKYFRMLAGNPKVTLSAGISIGHPKCPFYLLTHTANDLLEIAKKSNPNKNSVTVFDEIFTFKWDDFEIVEKYIKLLIPYFKKTEKEIIPVALPKTFFYRFLAIAKNFVNHNRLEISKFIYLLSRIGDKNIRNTLKTELEPLFTLDKKEWKCVYFALVLLLMSSLSKES